MRKAKVQAVLTTGWPSSRLMQDDCRPLHRWLANTPHARAHAKEAADEIQRNREMIMDPKTVYMQQTTKLRFWTDAQYKPTVLQQMWMCPETGRTEWRNIPLCYEPATKEPS